MAFPNLQNVLLKDIFLQVNDIESAKRWCRHNGLLKRNMDCVCGFAMEERAMNRYVDNVCWRCPQWQCSRVKNIRTGSFFIDCRLPLDKIIHLLYFWSQNFSNSMAVRHLELSEHTVVDWYNMIREVCSTDLINNPLVIGGVGHTVAIDESMVARRKPGNNLGRPVPSQWVFGGVDLATRQCFLRLVDTRDANTLLPIIQQMIAPGTRIWSDEWAAYGGLNGMGYLHDTVNHSRWYVDPVTGVHTNDIESLWCDCKRKFKRMNGVKRDVIPGYLDEFLWRKRRQLDLCFNDIVQCIRDQYPL